ncbi:histidine phosphatase family protein [Sporosarcina sp. D27]|uniref:histidine phosphatase family protein n=1 Tax=Sporosarcina sp. D27 TaxID=1382305 RepID=UPI000472106B|nr:histidine phosphatase family protein [Sporosarcina sp. D27]
MSTHIYLTRHGETVWNTKNLMQGWKNSPLTGKGIEQAKQLSQRLSDIPLHAIYSSTSDRAVTTAEIIKGERPLNVIKMDALREISFGSWEGKTFDENEKKTPEEWLSFWETPHLFSNDTVEPFVTVQERVVKTINNIVEEHPFETVCIVSHSIALKLLMDHFENNSLENLWSSPAIPSTSLTLVKVNRKSSEILFKYDTTHMRE